MYQRINVYQFRDAFRDMGRSDQFSYQGMEVLFDYLEDLEQDCGAPIDLDVIGLGCEYVEMDVEELIDAYSELADQLSDEFDQETVEQIVEDFLNDNTSICGRTKDGAYVFAQF